MTLNKVVALSALIYTTAACAALIAVGESPDGKSKLELYDDRGECPSGMWRAVRDGEEGCWKGLSPGQLMTYFPSIGLLIIQVKQQTKGKVI